MGDWKGAPAYAYQLGWQDLDLENDTLFGSHVYLSASDGADEYEWTIYQNIDGIDRVYNRTGQNLAFAQFGWGKAVITLKVRKFNKKCTEFPPIEQSTSKTIYVSKYYGHGYPGDSTFCVVGSSFNGKYKGVFEDKPTDTVVVEFNNCQPALFKDTLRDISSRKRFVRLSGLTDSCMISPTYYTNQVFSTYQLYLEDRLYKGCYFVRTYLSFVGKDRNKLKAVVSYSSYDDAYIENPPSTIRTFIGKRL